MPTTKYYRILIKTILNYALQVRKKKEKIIRTILIILLIIVMLNFLTNITINIQNLIINKYNFLK